MNTRQYEYILAVAELKNFSLAAEKCFISQSTLSTMIGRFEEEIDINIFDRKTKPVTITKEGEEIIAQLKVINKEISNLKDIAQSIKGELVGNLEIGVIPTIAPYLLPEFLNNFVKKYPNMNFTVSEMTTETILDLLEKRELDIGILAIPIGNKNLKEIPLYNEPFVLYDCTENPQKKEVTLEDIDFNKFWLLEEGHCLNTQVDTICNGQTCEVKENVNFDFKAGSIESLKRFVKMNNGITLLPSLSCLNFLPRDRKNLINFKEPIPVRTVGLAVHNHFRKMNLLQELKHDIQEKINPLIKSDKNEFVVRPLNS
tara:strand:+ start:382 stop:1323 length:942 start_codon:yes stop_codon:yes gene_type:complete